MTICRQLVTTARVTMPAWRPAPADRAPDGPAYFSQSSLEIARLSGGAPKNNAKMMRASILDAL